VVAVTDEAERRLELGVLAFEDFYQREYAGAVRLAFILTGRRDLAEELAQDTFLACLRRWDEVSGYDDPTGWVRRVLTNRCISSGRRHLTELRLLVKLGRERPASPTLSEPADRLWVAVRQLPKRQAQVLALAFVEDLDVHQIAATLAIGEESVRTHLRRGRAAIAARLEAEQDNG
jgi:RNA polymerase sigma factor (sigma-70 family)